MNTLAVLTIATNGYTKHWLDMYKSYLLTQTSLTKITFYVFTDQPKYLEQNILRKENINVRVIEIESLGWPDATLLRYEVYERYGHLINESYLMHLDADMLFIRPLNFNSLLAPINQMKLVSHPGFWRPKKLAKVRFYRGHITMLFRDLVRSIISGGVGTWESRKDSMAYVPFQKRRNYVCGGIWFGPRVEFLDLCVELAERVATDLSNGIIAKWHDESHLNWRVAHNDYHLLTPSYCFDSRYPQLRDLDEIIRAVDKENL